MGNFLFQAATTIAYALDHEQEFTMPDKTNDDFHNPIYLQHLVNPKWQQGLPQVLVCEDGHRFQKIPWNEGWQYRNVLLDGYWQSEKYFKHHRQRILDLFGYHWAKAPGIVSVHVRRGDYLRLTRKHPPVPASWYRECMREFPGATFKFFSDDIAWCKKEFEHDGNVVFSEGQPIEWDLVLMSCCEHHICSASTYAWWGAWLNRNPQKRVLIPKLWFTPQEAAKCPTDDIVPESWEKR